MRFFLWEQRKIQESLSHVRQLMVSSDWLSSLMLITRLVYFRPITQRYNRLKNSLQNIDPGACSLQ